MLSIESNEWNDAKNMLISPKKIDKIQLSQTNQYFVLKRKNHVKIWRNDEERLHPDCIRHLRWNIKYWIGHHEVVILIRSK